MKKTHTEELVDRALAYCEQICLTRLRPPDRLSSYFARLANRLFKKYGYTIQDRDYIQKVQGARDPIPFPLQKLLIQTYVEIRRSPEAFDATYALLADEESRETFDWYVQYRTAMAHIGFFPEGLLPAPIEERRFFQLCKEKKEEAESLGFTAWNMATLALGQYFLPERGACVENGDVVFDIGGCYGDTAYLFRSQSGDSGHVYVFEPVSAQKNSLERLCRDAGWDNVDIVPLGLWDSAGTAEIVVAGGASSMFGAASSGLTEVIETVTLDNFVQEHGVTQVDFIKMDIEGAEQNALLGSAETIAKFTPKLAISIYHLGNDMIRIPQIITEMNAEYRFYLRHYTAELSETILYAVPK